jgi:hypothetical protein
MGPIRKPPTPCGWAAGGSGGHALGEARRRGGWGPIALQGERQHQGLVRAHVMLLCAATGSAPRPGAPRPSGPAPRPHLGLRALAALAARLRRHCARYGLLHVQRPRRRLGAPHDRRHALRLQLNVRLRLRPRLRLWLLLLLLRLRCLLLLDLLAARPGRLLLRRLGLLLLLLRPRRPLCLLLRLGRRAGRRAGCLGRRRGARAPGRAAATAALRRAARGPAGAPRAGARRRKLWLLLEQQLRHGGVAVGAPVLQARGARRGRVRRRVPGAVGPRLGRGEAADAALRAVPRRADQQQLRGARGRAGGRV